MSRRFLVPPFGLTRNVAQDTMAGDGDAAHGQSALPSVRSALLTHDFAGFERDQNVFRRVWRMCEYVRAIPNVNDHAARRFARAAQLRSGIREIGELTMCLAVRSHPARCKFSHSGDLGSDCLSGCPALSTPRHDHELLRGPKARHQLAHRGVLVFASALHQPSPRHVY
jgi:hypothetical protein